MYEDRIYCGSARCNETISDEFVHYSHELRKVFHYKRGCALDAADDFVGNHNFELRQRWDFTVEEHDEELRFD